MKMDRAESLRQIITFGEFRAKAFTELVKFGYESEIECFELSDKLLANILEMYIAGSITADDLEEWANFIDFREDVNDSMIEDYIYALANPEIMGDINVNKITQMLKVLTTPK